MRPNGVNRKSSPKKTSARLFFRPPFGPFAAEVRQFAPLRLNKLKPAGACARRRLRYRRAHHDGTAQQIRLCHRRSQNGQAEVMVSGQVLEERQAV